MNDYFLLVCTTPQETLPAKECGEHFRLNLTMKLGTPDQVTTFLWGKRPDDWLLIYVRDERRIAIRWTADLNLVKARLNILRQIGCPT